MRKKEEDSVNEHQAAVRLRADCAWCARRCGRRRRRLRRQARALAALRTSTARVSASPGCHTRTASTEAHVVALCRPARQVPTPLACAVWVGRVEVVQQHPKHGARASEAEYAQRVDGDAMRASLMYRRQEHDRQQEANGEAANVREVWAELR